ncbi:hypothetical protein MAR_012757 [Mya arenaria]|uniref:Uncharacterized protein n=1 Tax=Mya arenaria TaxID=6604 RepID=A0ABY7G1Q2_MYAAR|nr:hypothetical protein MAR_012757 [Mya arenaria]
MPQSKSKRRRKKGKSGTTEGNMSGAVMGETKPLTDSHEAEGTHSTSGTFDDEYALSSFRDKKNSRDRQM